MGVEIIAVLIPIIVSLGIFVMIVFIRKYENEEKLAMIDKGLNPNDNRPPKIASMAALRLGLLVIGAGIGLLIGNLLQEIGIQEPVAYFSMVLIFGGIGLIASYIIEQRRIKKLEEKNQ